MTTKLMRRSLDLTNSSRSFLTPEKANGFRKARREELKSSSIQIASARASIGAEVRALRRSQSLTQAEFANRVGISVSMISKIEHGKVGAPIETLMSIAQKFDVSFLSFFRRIA